MKAEAYFIAAIAEDGQIITLPELPEEGIDAKRPITNYDVYTTAKQIVDEFESSILAQKVAETVIRAMNPVEPAVSDKVKEALKERGFKTE
jgi:NADP-dependent 3-hydroxy acid dehydrogenase YdfG